MDGRPVFGCRLHLRSGEPYDNLYDRAVKIEKFGYDSVFVDDHLLYGTSQALAPDPFVISATLAIVTEKVLVGIAVTDLLRRHPAIVAQAATTISSMMPARFVLGLGTGDSMNQTPFGFPTDHKVGRLEEGIKVLRMLWGSSIEKPVTYDGRFYHLDHAYLQTDAISHRVPIYIAAFGERMLKLTGREGDGWIPHCHTPETYHDDLVKIMDAARDVGRSEDEILPAYHTVASIGGERGEAERLVLGPARYFLALIPEALRKIDPTIQHPGRVWEKPGLTDPRKQRELIRSIASRIPDDTALNTAIHGRAEDCIEQLSRYMKNGCRDFHLTFAPPSGLWSGDEMMPMARLFAEKVVSYFHEMNDAHR